MCVCIRYLDGMCVCIRYLMVCVCIRYLTVCVCIIKCAGYVSTNGADDSRSWEQSGGLDRDGEGN